MAKVEWNAQEDDFPAKVNLVDRDGNVRASIVLTVKNGKVVAGGKAGVAAEEPGT